MEGIEDFARDRLKWEEKTDEGLYCDALDMLEKEKDIDDDVREEGDIVCFWKDDDFAIDM